jgi:hypothetical protein
MFGKVAILNALVSAVSAGTFCIYIALFLMLTSIQAQSSGMAASTT